MADNKLIAKAVEELKGSLPEAWSVETRTQSRGVSTDGASRLDIVVDIVAPDGRRAELVVEAKASMSADRVEATLRRLVSSSGTELSATPTVVSSYLNERSRDRVREAGAAYLDLTGNVYLSLDDPAVLIEREGADKNPWPTERPARSLRGAKAGRLVRALVDLRPPFGIREFAERAGMDPGYVSRLVSMLEKDDLVDRTRRGPVERVDWPGLLRAWAQDYSLTGSNRSETYLEPRGLDALTDKLRAFEGGVARPSYAVTGSLAAARRAPVAPSRLAACYVSDIERVAEALGLVEADTGANVLLLEPFDEVVFERTVEDDGLTYVAPSQAVVDLLTSPGRGPDEGEALIGWMRENEAVWRA